MFNLRSPMATVMVSTVAVAVTGLLSSSTQAAQFSFAYSRANIQASGILTTTDLNPVTNQYTVTGITGQRNGAQITGLVSKQAPGTEKSYYRFSSGDGFYYDNILFNSAPWFDQGGILFTVESLKSPVNVFFDPTAGQYLDDVYTGQFHWDVQNAYTKYDRLPINFKLERIEQPTDSIQASSPSSAAVPEPAELMGTALAGALLIGGGLIRRRVARAKANQLKLS